MPKMQQFTDYNFQLGLNADLSEIQVSKKELVTADNADIMARGGVRKRFGVEGVNSTSYEETVHQLIEFPRADGDIDLLAVMDSGLYNIASDGSKTLIQSLNANKIAYFYLLDKFYFIDPGTEYYQYDGTSVSAVTPNSDEENNLAPIKNCKYAHYHTESNRIFFSGNSNDASALYYSEYNDPTFVKGTNVVYPTRAEGAVRGLNVLMDAVIVGYRRGFYIWRGIDPVTDAIWEKLPTSRGVANNDAFALTTNSLSFVSDEGIYAMTPNIMGITMENEAGKGYITDIAKDRVSSLLKDCTNKEGIRAVFYNRESKLLIAYSDQASGINNKILVFDFDTKGFSLYTDIQANDFCEISNGDMYVASDNYIFKLSNTSTEDLSPSGVASIIDFKIKTPKYGLGNPFVRKALVKIFLIYKNFGAVHELKVSLYVDNEKVEEYTINGDDSGTEIITKRLKTYYSGNNFQLEIENNQYSEVEIYGLGMQYRIADTGGDKANE